MVCAAGGDNLGFEAEVDLECGCVLVCVFFPWKGTKGKTEMKTEKEWKKSDEYISTYIQHLQRSGQKPPQTPPLRIPLSSKNQLTRHLQRPQPTKPTQIQPRPLPVTTLRPDIHPRIPEHAQLDQRLPRRLQKRRHIRHAQRLQHFRAVRTDSEIFSGCEAGDETVELLKGAGEEEESVQG